MKEFFVFVCPVQKCQAPNQVLEGLTIYMEVPDLATVENKASKNFHDVSFICVWFEIFQFFYSFCNGLYSSWRYNVTQKIVFLREKNVLSEAALRSTFRRRVWHPLMTVNISFLFWDCIILSLSYVIDCFFLMRGSKCIDISRLKKFGSPWKLQNPRVYVNGLPPIIKLVSFCVSGLSGTWW